VDLNSTIKRSRQPSPSAAHHLGRESCQGDHQRFPKASEKRWPPGPSRECRLHITFLSWSRGNIGASFRHHRDDSSCYWRVSAAI